MERYVCIHGHFYQPPRENPWLESIELQDSAHPYHDWNERITAECYGPNALSRILDEQGRITQIVNNYSKISFNFGPTLLAWMQEKSPQVYQRILEADQESQNRFSGHGSAIAQAYNHIIMPLANTREKLSQVLWGIKDFQCRFGRQPEGMWLPETAVDLESLDLMAQQGIKFTILAPHQARRVRRIKGRSWKELNPGNVDPTQVYELILPSGRKINLFFYDGPVSRAVAFERLLEKGEYLVDRLLGAFSDKQTRAQLVHIATDGETYGHHHRFGDMALAFALHHLEQNHAVRLTNYAEYLEKHPPTHQVEIHENSSWSCTHGIERWRSDCGCNTGRHPEWNQAWRAPLREALDWLRDSVALPYQEKAIQYLHDPWAARDDYIEVILDRSPQNLQRYLQKHSRRSLNQTEQSEVLKLLELQRHALLMYTSCGWFFDELYRIETVQVMQYAARVIQLAEELFQSKLEPRFIELISRAKSNINRISDGGKIYHKFVKPAMLDLKKVGAHYAVSSLFENYGQQASVYCYSVEQEDFRLMPVGKARLALGRIKITSAITQESARVSLGVLTPGDYNIYGGIREFQGEEAYQKLVEETTSAFGRADLAELIRTVDRNFGSGTYTLKLLFRDEQSRIISKLIESAAAEAESTYERLYRQYAPLLRFLAEVNQIPPKALQSAAEVALNFGVKNLLLAENPDLIQVNALVEEAAQAGITLNSQELAPLMQDRFEENLARFESQPSDLNQLQGLNWLLDLSALIGAEINLWTSQNIYYRILKNIYPQFKQKSEAGEEFAREWLRRFQDLGTRLFVKV